MGGTEPSILDASKSSLGLDSGLCLGFLSTIYTSSGTFVSLMSDDDVYN